MQDTEKLIGSTQAARLLDIDKSTLTRWVHAGRLTVAARPSEKSNAAMLFRLGDVKKLAEDLTGQVPT